MAKKFPEMSPIGGDGVAGGDILNTYLLAALAKSLADPTVVKRVEALASRLPEEDQELVRQAIECLLVGLAPDAYQLRALTDAGFIAGLIVNGDGTMVGETFIT